MQINPIKNTNNTNFGTKIKFNKTLEEGFKHAKSCSSSAKIKELNYSKEFVDSLRAILDNHTDTSLEVVSNKVAGTYTRIADGYNNKIANTYIPNEGSKCIEAVKNYAKILPVPEPTNLDTLKRHLDNTLNLVEVLKNKYSKALAKEIENLEKRIKQDV